MAVAPISTHRSYVRIQVAPVGTTSLDSAVKWTDLEAGTRYDAPKPTDKQGPTYWARNVYSLESLTQACLPEYGQAIFSAAFGTMSGKVVRPEELTGRIVRVLLAQPPIDPILNNNWDKLDWICWFVGRVEYQRENIQSQQIVYTAYDLLFSDLRKLSIGKKAVEAVDDSTVRFVEPNPGYNVSDGIDNANRHSSAASFSGVAPHWGPGSSYDERRLWTDKEIVENILATAKTFGTSTYTLSASTLMGNGSDSYPLDIATTCWELLNRVLDRKRGFLATPVIAMPASGDNLFSAALTSSVITIGPMFYDDITYTDVVTSAGVTIQGALSKGNVISTVDLSDDHRVRNISINENGIRQYGSLVTEGDPLRVMVTLSARESTLSEGWNSAQATAYASASTTELAAGRFANVFRRYTIPPIFNYLVGDGTNVTTKQRCDFCTDDGGNISTLSAEGLPPMPDSMVVIERTLPIRNGWDYSTSSPLPYDSQALGDQQEVTPMLVLYDGVAYAAKSSQQQLNFTVSGREFMIMEPEDGSRYFDTFPDNLNFTVSLRYPNRVRFTHTESSDPAVKRIRVTGAALHLAVSTAIWSFNPATEQAVLTGCAGGTGSTPGILRDDRSKLQYAHELAKKWYIDDHRPLEWTMEGNGFVPYVTESGAYSAGTEWFPLGYVVYKLAYPERSGVTLNGRPTATGVAIIADTPITKVTYNRRDDTTTWRTDWGDING